MFENLANKVSNTYKGIITQISPIPTDSKFLETGILTPSEFLKAGDQLTKACPSWQWKPTPDPKYKNTALPDEKQFLTTQCQSNKRVKQLMTENSKEENLDEDWVINETIKSSEEQNAGCKLDVKSDYIKGEGEGMQEETKCNPQPQPPIFKIEEPEFTETRYYDLTITYDFYYHTPRLWLSGNDESNAPLKPEQIFEDIMAEYANKTVTIEENPFLGIKQASVHPCKHAAVMKYFIDTAKDNGVSIEPHQALFVFLKFMASIIPTIEYDFTVDIVLG